MTTEMFSGIVAHGAAEAEDTTLPKLGLCRKALQCAITAGKGRESRQFVELLDRSAPAEWDLLRKNVSVAARMGLPTFETRTVSHGSEYEH
jgi:hypothetical protein